MMRPRNRDGAEVIEEPSHLVGAGRRDHRAPAEALRDTPHQRQEPPGHSAPPSMGWRDPHTLGMEQRIEQPAADDLRVLLNHQHAGGLRREQRPDRLGFGPCEARPFLRRQDAAGHYATCSTTTSSRYCASAAGLPTYVVAY